MAEKITQISIMRPHRGKPATIVATVDICDGAKAVCSLGTEDYISLPFELQSPVTFKIGDYVDLTTHYGKGESAICDIPSLARRYTLTQKAQFTYTEAGGYKYDLKLEADYRKWQNRIYMYRTSDTLKESDFTLTTTLENQLKVFIEALIETYGNDGYGYRIDGGVTQTAKAVQYNNTSYLAALDTLASTYECEWWMEGNVICFGRNSKGDSPLDWKVGENVESVSGTNSNQKFTTRLYAFGSTRNISEAYRKSSVNGRKYVAAFVDKRLALPGDGYIDAYPGLTDAEVVEEVKTFDEVYPKTKLIITNVATVEGTYTDSKDGKKKTELLYRFLCSFEDGTPFYFSQDYILPGEELSMVFQLPQDKRQDGSENTDSPVLLGWEFGLAFNPDNEREKNSDGTWNSHAQRWQIVPQEKSGRRLPEGDKENPTNNVLIPHVGDTFALLGWDAFSSAYNSIVEQAEEELQREAEDYLASVCTDPTVHECPYMADTTTDFSQLHLGRRVDLYSEDNTQLAYRNSRIVGYTINLDNPLDHPTFKVGELAPRNRLEAMQQAIANFRKGADGADGKKGADGESVTIDSSKTGVVYGVSSSATVKPTSWQTTVPSVAQGKYLWSKTTTTYTDGSDTVTYSVSRQGENGTSVRIKQKSVTYAVTNTATQPADIISPTIPSVGLGQYLWSKTTVIYTDGNGTETVAVSRVGNDGDTVVGDSAFVHFAYSKYYNGKDDKGNNAFQKSWFDGALYIGICSDTNAEDPEQASAYTWARLRGVDGDNAISYKLSVNRTNIARDKSGEIKSGQTISYKALKSDGHNIATAPDNEVYVEIHTVVGDSYYKGATVQNSLAPNWHGGVLSISLYNSDKTLLYDEVNFIYTQDGNTGLQGAIQRITQWQDGKTYLNESEEMKEVRYIDVVVLEDTTSPTGYKGYICKKTNTADSTNAPGSGASWATYWTEMQSFEPILTPMIMAQQGAIKFMQGNQLLIYDSTDSKDNSKIVAGMVGGEYPLWVGGTTPEGSAFKVHKDGTIYANPYSFLIDGDQLGDYVGLFQIIYKQDAAGKPMKQTVGGVEHKLIDYMIPQYPMKRASITELSIGNLTLTYDSKNEALQLSHKESGKKAGFYASGFVSALGANSTMSGGGGSYDMLQTWGSYTSEKANYVVPASLLYSLYGTVNSLGTSVGTIQANGATTIETTGSGNAITSVSKDGNKITFTKGATYNNYTLPTASASVLGGVKIGSNITISNGVISTHAPYSLPTASSTTKGGITLGYTQTGKTYPVALDANGRAYVSVPWTDHYAWNDITGKPATATRWPAWSEVTDKPTSMPANGGNADTLDSYHRSNLFAGFADFINTLGRTQTITVLGDKETYYPVVISLPSSKEIPTIISVWKNLDSPTPSISGNHGSGTSSMWLLYEGRYTYWDGNGGFCRLLHRSMPYANLCAEAFYDTTSAGKLVLYLRGGGCEYKISATNPVTVTVYTKSVNIGISKYPVYVEPRTTIGNKGVINTQFPLYGKSSYSALADAATKLQTPRTIWGRSFDGSADISGDLTGVANIKASGELELGSKIWMANGASIYAKNTSGSYEQFLWPRWNDNVMYLNFGSGGFNIRNKSSSNVMWMSNNGQVGIGTTSPSYKLDVAGTARITGAVTMNSALSVGGTVTTNNISGTAVKINGNSSVKLQSGSCRIEVDNDDIYLRSDYSITLSCSGTNMMYMEADEGIVFYGPITAHEVIHGKAGIYSDTYVSALGQNTSSDARLKDITKTVTLRTEDIANAPSVEFAWKKNGQRAVGTIAQYWQNVLPLAVHEDYTEDKHLTMQYDVCALLSSISNAKEILKLREENKYLMAEVAALRNGMTDLRRMINELKDRKQ